MNGFVTSVYKKINVEDLRIVISNINQLTNSDNQIINLTINEEEGKGRRDFKMKCCYCESDKLTRVFQTPWTNWFPRCKCYTCQDCQGLFITLYNLLKIGINSGYSRILLANKTNISSI
jgi:hypothetical protein